ncbi:lytic transglycosylase F [Bosea sp. BK604]|uniref:transglycosylase SLT domain-containing protein n=1 Tax=Bosea sp. BK604 TaxID=2512180 RepID=UPI001053AD10|nr:lytic transglycosylase F [Bosea sp. BK604]TCR65739.1 membrane-bound lytic murein transglycosylase MltF [Bosea sp. BK604]
MMRLLVALCLACASLATPALGQSARPKPIVASLPQLKPWTGDLDGMLERRVIRILVPYSKTLFFIDRGRQLGVIAELGQRFQSWINARHKTRALSITVAFVPVPRGDFERALNEGRGDIVAGNLTITPERLATMDFAEPWMSNVREVVVTGPAAPALNSIEDLAGRDVYVREGSSYASHLRELGKGFEAKGLKPIILKPADENLEDEDILEMVNAGLLPFAIVDDHKAALWSRVFTSLKLRADLAVHEGGSVAWAMRKNSPLLKQEIDAFVHEHKLGTAFGNDVKRRYFASDRIVKNAYSPEDAQRFRDLVALFRAQGEAYRFDWLMLMAQGYQESQLDQNRRSHRGAVGVMQLLPKTAAAKPIEITGVDTDAGRNIQAGAAYMRYITETYIAKDPAIDARNRVLFAFAAYNAGPGNLRKFRRIAKEKGLDPNLWFGNVEHAAAQVVGRETVQYVSNIYKYFVAYSLLLGEKGLTAASP